MVRYHWEYDRHVRALHVGCGGHSFRNILPCYRYAPVELVGLVDRELERAKRCAKLFGAEHAYDDFATALSATHPDAVFIVTGYDASGRPTYHELAMQAMEAGAHAWIEKPPAASTGDVLAMRATERTTGRFVMVGLKKMFFPAIERARELIARPEFGPLTTLAIRYPQAVPAREAMEDTRAHLGFLDHLCHPASILYFLGGAFRSVFYRREPQGGGAHAVVELVNGAVAGLHLCAGISGTSPLERVEAVGRGANLVVENGCRLVYYRPGRRGPGGYGREESFLGAQEESPQLWEPEFSLGTLYNASLFLLGYAQEIRAFCNSVLSNTAPERSGLDAAFAVTALYEAFLNAEGIVTNVQDLSLDLG